MKILCVHGVGHDEDKTQLQWQTDWTAAIRAGIQTSNADLDPEIAFAEYDALFQPVLNNLTAGQVADAFYKLVGGTVASDLGGLFNRPRALPNFSDNVRWTAGMVVAWVENDQLRADSRQAVLDKVADFQPDVVCAHSLGTLISYDAFRQNQDALAGKIFVTFGSQLGNHFVKREAFGGRIDPFAGADFWFHLYNPNDHVFTEQLQLGGDQFRQVFTPFGAFLAWAINHDAAIKDQPLSDNAYLSHTQTRAQVWPHVTLKAAAVPAAVAAGVPDDPAAAALPTAATAATARAFTLRAAVKKTAAAPKTPNNRALLVGINAYPEPANRLEGCVNDVFLVSSVLQETGFAAEDIRVVLDDRATAAAILERLHWLLEGTDSDDTRFFYYSGHGAQLPAYGPDGKIQRIDACLAPYDFAWTAETAVTDDRIVDLYSQLPYDVHFMMAFDSCYSGGLTRGGLRARGLEPPDDIRHRMLRWDKQRQMWVARDLPRAAAAPAAGGREVVGASRATRPLGRAVSLRPVSLGKAEQAQAQFGHDGPYLPVVYEACREDELAYEYRHGAISQGAFTYALAAILRRHGMSGHVPTYAELLEETARTLQELGYNQHPVMVGPKPRLEKTIPWQGAQ
jgi:metacaspase-1